MFFACLLVFSAFQFQYGAIRSKHKAIIALLYGWFQFQYGAIRSFAAVKHFPLFQIRFNSSMVRLGGLFFWEDN